MEKMDVPAETLPVRGPTAFVAVMPVPASPSAGANTMPSDSMPSRRAAPAAVSLPAGHTGGQDLRQQIAQREGLLAR